MEENENLNNDNLSSSMFDSPENNEIESSSMFDAESLESDVTDKAQTDIKEESSKPAFNFDVEAEIETPKPTVEAQKTPLEVIDDNFEEDETKDKPTDVVTVRPVRFKKFETTPPIRTIKKNLDIMQDVSMHVSVELGRTKLSIKEVMDFEQGSVVELNKIAGEQVEVFVNGKLIAKGEVIVIEDRFGVRITSTNVSKNPANP